MEVVQWKERFEILLDSAFDYKKALERQGLNHSDVMELRKRLSDKSKVPKFIHDKHVSWFFYFIP